MMKTSYECLVFFFKQKTAYEMLRCLVQAEDGIRDAQESRGLGDVYKRQIPAFPAEPGCPNCSRCPGCLLYTSDAADDLTRVDLGGRRIIKKKKKIKNKEDHRRISRKDEDAGNGQYAT